MDSALTLTRSVLVVFVPGIVALAPWLLLGVNRIPNFQRLYHEYPLPFHIAAFALVVVIGSLIEGATTYFEKKWDDKVAKAPEPDKEDDWLSKDWYDYLASQFGDKEPVGYRYLSRKVTELYFCLTMMVASPIGIIGFGVLLAFHGTGFCVSLAIAVAAGLIALWGFRKFSIDTHCLLYSTRMEIMYRLRNKEAKTPGSP